MAIVVGARSRRGATSVRFVLGVVASLSFVFFIYSAIRQRVEPNWPAPAYIPAIVLLAAAPWARAASKWLARRRARGA